MSAGPGTLARVTAPLAPADPLFNRLNDLGERHPWLWLGMTPPDPRRPLPVRAHVWIAVTGVAGAALVELVAHRRGVLSSGSTLTAERVGTAVTGLAIWAAATGAWDRRVHRRRGWRALVRR